MAKDYNATLNLPKTDFPMRAGLPKREPEMLKRWLEQDIYNEMLKKNEGKPRFNLHDGPPFSNGDIHMGHALNKSLKDFINRCYMMRGYDDAWSDHVVITHSDVTAELFVLSAESLEVADAFVFVH